MNRRNFLRLSSLFAVAGLTACRFDGKVFNPCKEDTAPEAWLTHPTVTAAWEGVDEQNVWDGHVHLVGTGDSDSGVWVNPEMRSLWHPWQYSQMKFYLNAACSDDTRVDDSYVERLIDLKSAFPSETRFMLLAFDYFHDDQGERVESLSTFYTPNAYAASIHQRHPDHFEWIASVHPYRADCVDELHLAYERGARAVKWLPPAMGIDPASPKCDRFYAAMAKLKLPLLTHAGDEHAVKADDFQRMGNPLLLRRALGHGVRVVVAHCASQGQNFDLDNPSKPAYLDNFDLFGRMMDETAYDDLLYGEISAITQVNRAAPALAKLLQRREWHTRLVNGSDYPLPGVMPLFSWNYLVKLELLSESVADVCKAIRGHNPLLADFVCKRHLSYNGASFPSQVFESKRVYGTPVKVV